MIIVPIVLSAGGTGDNTRTPHMNRLDFPNLNPGDAVGVVRQEGTGWLSPTKWCWYVYVIPADNELYYPDMEGQVQRHWSFHDVGFAATRRGAFRKLNRAVAVYRDGMTKEIKEFPL